MIRKPGDRPWAKDERAYLSAPGGDLFGGGPKGVKGLMAGSDGPKGQERLLVHPWPRPWLFPRQRAAQSLRLAAGPISW